MFDRLRSCECEQCSLSIQNHSILETYLTEPPLLRGLAESQSLIVAQLLELLVKLFVKVDPT